MTSFGGKNLKVNMSVLSNTVDRTVYRIDDLLEGTVPLNLVDQDLLDQTYQNEIQDLLLMNEIVKVSKGVINLENKLGKLERVINVDLKIPNLSKFYFNLSPVFLQSIIENEGIEDLEMAKSTWLGAVRIALEEELTLWQEKTEFRGH